MSLLLHRISCLEHFRSPHSKHTQRLDISPQIGNTDGKIGIQCGQEAGKNPLGIEEGVRYAGTSWIGKLGNGVIRISDTMGRGEEGVIVVDTEEESKWVLRMEPGEEVAE